MCVYCEGDLDLYYDDIAFVSIVGDGISILVLDEDRDLYRFSRRLPIRYCPICGRDMKGYEMRGFYRFPAMKGLEEWDNADQISKLEEELKETKDAYFGSTGEIPYGLELMDVIQAAETALRMNFSENEVEHLRQLTIEKNRKRGYYGEEDGE